jgi:hypothetical protein
MQKPFTPNLLHWLIAFVWLANGLLCKVLNLVPRHQQIVARILGDEHARVFTVLIGVAEVAMVVWILSGIRKRLNVLTQILVVATMNTLEFFLVPDLLLWGKANVVFAAVFIGLIYYNEFRPAKKLTQHATCSLF